MTPAGTAEVIQLAPPGDRRRRRRWAVVGAVTAALLATGLGVAAWLGGRSAPSVTGGGWWSEDMETATSEGLTQSHQVFRCEPGRFEARIDLVSDGPVPITVTDVQVPMLDDTLALDGRARRTSTEMMRDPNGDLYDLVEFRSASVGGSDWARLVLTWDVRECPVLAGYMIEDRVEVTYVALGMTHTATLPLGLPMAFTSLSLDELP